jgi:hypothetical protein
MFQTGCAPGIELFEGFPFRGIAIHLSVRLARLALARPAPSRSLAGLLARLPGFDLRRSPLPRESRSSRAARASLEFLPPPGIERPGDGSGHPGSSSPGVGPEPIGKPLARDAPFGVLTAGGLGVSRRLRRPSWGLCTFSLSVARGTGTGCPMAGEFRCRFIDVSLVYLKESRLPFESPLWYDRFNGRTRPG